MADRMHPPTPSVHSIGHLVQSKPEADHCHPHNWARPSRHLSQRPITMPPRVKLGVNQYRSGPGGVIRSLSVSPLECELVKAKCNFLLRSYRRPQSNHFLIGCESC